MSKNIITYRLVLKDGFVHRITGLEYNMRDVFVEFHGKDGKLIIAAHRDTVKAIINEDNKGHLAMIYNPTKDIS